MRFVENVHGSEASAKPLIVGKTTVYVHTNIHTETIADEMGERTEWVYDEAQYTKNEWIDELTKQSTQAQEQIFDLENIISDLLLAL